MFIWKFECDVEICKVVDLVRGCVDYRMFKYRDMLDGTRFLRSGCTTLDDKLAISDENSVEEVMRTNLQPEAIEVKMHSQQMAEHF